MLLTIDENSEKVGGQYYDNDDESPIYLGESILDKNSMLTLKEFTNYHDAYISSNPTGIFIGKLDKKMVFIRDLEW